MSRLAWMLSALLVTSTATAADLYVTTTGTDGPTCGPVVDPCATVSSAVANAAPGDTVNVAAGTYLDNVVLDKDLQLVGAFGAVIDGGGEAVSTRVLTVAAGVVAVVSDLVITNGWAVAGEFGGGIHNRGTLTLDDVQVSYNVVTYAADVRGGGIYNDGGSITMTGGAVSGNAAFGNDPYVCDLNPQEAYGGAIYNAGGVAVLAGGTMLDNRLGWWQMLGAGIYNDSSGTITVTDFDIAGNGPAYDFTCSDLTSSWGGGLFNLGGSSILRSDFSANYAENGGAVCNRGGMSLADSTVRDGSAGGIWGGDAGGILNTGDLTLYGSAVHDNRTSSGFAAGLSSEGSLTIVNTTVSGNSAFGNLRPSVAGGIAVHTGGTATLINSSIVGNSVSGAFGNEAAGGVTVADAFPPLVVTLRNTIVAGNDGGGAPPDCSGRVSSDGYNLIGVLSPECVLSGDLTGVVTDVDPLLGPLADNGGPSRSHAPQPGSPAVDAGDPAGCTDELGAPLVFDQRAAPRPACARCDLGAVEAGLASAGADAESCGGAEVVLTGTAVCDCLSPEYQWLEGAVVVQPWSADPELRVTPPTSTTYTLEVRCANGPTGSDDVVVSVFPAAIPGDLGNTVRAVRRVATVVLTWAGDPAARTYTLYRGTAKDALVPEFPGLTDTTLVRTDLGGPSLFFYRAVAVNCLDEEGP